jgi:hypothetical protein
MKATYFKTLLSVASVALLCATTMISSQSPASALAFETKKPTKGQDVGDKNCERVDTPESSTFGKCKSVCKDKDVTWDAVNRRYVCKAAKSVGGRPFGPKAPVADKAQASDASPTPKQRQPVGPKSGKAKKN